MDYLKAVLEEKEKGRRWGENTEVIKVTRGLRTKGAE